MIQVGGQHCVVCGRTKLDPVINVKLLKSLFVNRGWFLERLTIW